MTKAPRTTTLTLPDAAVVSGICFGLFTYWSLQAVLAGFPTAEFSDDSNVWGVGLELGLATAALAYLRLRGFDIASLYPEPTVQGIFLGLGLFVASWLAETVLLTLLRDTGQGGGTEFSYERSGLVSTILMAMVNGAFEEVFLLGVLTCGLRGYGLSIALGLPLLVRTLYHLYQGPAGAVSIVAFGLMFALFYLRVRQLWPLVLAHILWDIVPAYV